MLSNIGFWTWRFIILRIMEDWRVMLLFLFNNGWRLNLEHDLPMGQSVVLGLLLLLENFPPMSQGRAFYNAAWVDINGIIELETYLKPNMNVFAKEHCNKTIKNKLWRFIEFLFQTTVFDLCYNRIINVSGLDLF